MDDQKYTLEAEAKYGIESTSRELIDDEIRDLISYLYVISSHALIYIHMEDDNGQVAEYESIDLFIHDVLNSRLPVDIYTTDLFVDIDDIMTPNDAHYMQRIDRGQGINFVIEININIPDE